MLTAGLFLLVLALLRGNQDGWRTAPIVVELAGGGALLLAFLLVEKRFREPMLPLGLFRNRAFTGAQVVAFSISASFFALFLYTTLYLQNILHLSPLNAGLVYLPGTILLFVVSGATAELSKRIPAGTLVAGGLILSAAGLALMTLAQASSSWLALLPGLLVVCAGTGLFNPALAAVALGSLSDAQSGLAAGVNDAFRQGGIAVGVAAYGVLIPAGAALGHGSSATFVTGLTLVAAGLSLILLADANSSWTALMPGILLCSLGTGLFNPAVVAIALGSVSEQQSGLAAGTNDAFRQGGIAVGVAVFGAVVPAASALGGGPAADYVSGMHHAAIIAAALAGIGAIACARLFRVGLGSSGKQLAKAAVAVSSR